MTHTIYFSKPEKAMFKEKPQLIVEIVKGKVRWFYRIKARNGEPLTTSQKYFSHSNALRAAQKTADRINATLKKGK